MWYFLVFSIIDLEKLSCNSLYPLNVSSRAESAQIFFNYFLDQKILSSNHQDFSCKHKLQMIRSKSWTVSWGSDISHVCWFLNRHLNRYFGSTFMILIWRKFSYLQREWNYSKNNESRDLWDDRGFILYGIKVKTITIK